MEENNFFDKIYWSIYQYQNFENICIGHSQLITFYRVIYLYESIGRYARHKIQIK